MSVPSKERFFNKNLSIELSRSSALFDKIDYKYTCTDKDKKYTKSTKLSFLGLSPHKDMVPEKARDSTQYLLCDEDGNIYEALVIRRVGRSYISALRTDRINKEKKVKKPAAEGEEATLDEDDEPEDDLEETGGERE